MADSRATVTPVGDLSLDDVAWSETEAKGFLPAKVTDGQHELEVVFYNLTRLSHDVEAEIDVNGHFASPPIVVLPSISRAAVEAAAESLAASGFASVSRW